jgi:hypothetical protein
MFLLHTIILSRQRLIKTQHTTDSTQTMATHLRDSTSSSSKTVAPPLSSIATQRLKRELVRLQHDPPPGIAAYLSDDSDDLSKWTAHIRGPVDTPFEGTIFLISIPHILGLNFFSGWL